MPLIIYNWLNSLGVLTEDRLKLTEIIYDNRAIDYIAVDMDYLKISDETMESFEKETANYIRLSDIDEEGRLVNIRYCAGVTGTIR